MRIALKTFRDEMRHLVDVADQNDYIVDSIIDVDTKKWGETYRGIEIISPFEARKRYHAGAIDQVILPGARVAQKLLDAYYAEHLDFGYSAEDILFNVVENLSCDTVRFVPKSAYRYLDYLEFHTNDHCNLNCKHCNNYSNLVQEPHFTDYDGFEKDLYRLRELVDHIRLIRVLGGEPLLNGETWRFLQLVRKVYPYAEINLVTNGLLVMQMDERLQETVRKTGAILSISAYPVIFDQMDAIGAFLRTHEIPFKIGWIATRFRAPLMERFGYPLEKVDCQCVHLRDGKLARCPLVQYLDYYNAHYGTQYHGEDGVIDLYDQTLTYEMLDKRLQTPFALCDCCGFWRDDLPGEPWSREKA